MEQNYQIHVFENGAALPGQYVFPFKLTLPKNCPSTIDWRGPMDAFANVHYTITATLFPSPKVKIKPMSFKQALVVRQRPPHDRMNIE
jgi:hypothetical protein